MYLLGRNQLRSSQPTLCSICQQAEVSGLHSTLPSLPIELALIKTGKQVEIMTYSFLSQLCRWFIKEGIKGLIKLPYDYKYSPSHQVQVLFISASTVFIISCYNHFNKFKCHLSFFSEVFIILYSVCYVLHYRKIYLILYKTTAAAVHHGTE